MSELKNFKPKVKKILEDHEAARNNDGTLYAHFIKKHCSQLTMTVKVGEEEIDVIPLRNFKKLPALENLRRVRQIIQNDNQQLQPTDPDVRKARKIKEQNFREAEVREAVQYKA